MLSVKWRPFCHGLNVLKTGSAQGITEFENHTFKNALPFPMAEEWI